MEPASTAPPGNTSASGMNGLRALRRSMKIAAGCPPAPARSRITVAAGRGGFSPHRMLLAGMALSTAFTMLLMMLQASGDPRMAGVLPSTKGAL